MLNELSGIHFEDQRLQDLLLRYKARNYYGILANEEEAIWKEYRLSRLTDEDMDIIVD